MKSEHLFIIRLGDGRHFEYEGTLDGAKRKASKLATPPVAIQLLAEQRLPRSSLRRAPFTAFSCISTLKSSHPEGSVREKIVGTGSDTYGSLWRRTDSGMEKGRGRSDGLGEGETFLENSPSPMPPDAFSAHPFCILYGDARTPFLLHGSPRIRIVRTINTNVTIRPLFRHERRLGSPLPHPETDQQGEPP